MKLQIIRSEDFSRHDDLSFPNIVNDKSRLNTEDSMSLISILEKAEEYASTAKKNPPQKIDADFEFPDKRGVYLIYKEKTVIYVGRSSSLKKRLERQLSEIIEPQDNGLRESLERQYKIKPSNTRNWMMEHCEFSFTEIENPDMCKLVESLLITHFRAQNRYLLYS